MPRRPRVARRSAGLASRCLLAMVLSAVPASAAQRPFTVDLGARRDFVAQTNNVQCVGASMQMMLNMLVPGADRSGRDPAATPEDRARLEPGPSRRSRAPWRQRHRLGGAA